MDTSAILGFKQPDTMQNLSSLLGAAAAAQGMQATAQGMQKTGIDIQNQGMSLHERQGMSQFLSDPSNYTDASGNLDMPKFQAGASKVAPTTWTKYANEVATAQTAATQASTALNGLDNDNRTLIGRSLSALAANNAPPDVVNKTFDAFEQQRKGAKPLIDYMRTTYNNIAQAQGPDAAAQHLTLLSNETLPQETQQTMNTPSVVTVNNGQQQVGINIKPGVHGYGQGAPVYTVQNQVAPGGLENVESDAQGNRFIVSRTPSGAVTGTRPLQSASPGAPGPFTLPQGETQDTLKQVQGIRTNANQSAKTVPDQQFNSNQIIKLADETNTGKGSQIVQGLKGGYAGIPWTSNSADNYNQLGHYMALQTSQLSQSSGLGGTDAAHSIAAEQAGNKDWTSGAIKRTARVNRALSTGTLLFNQGVENAVGTGGPFAARDFQSKWSRVANVDALRVYDAYKNQSEDPEGWKAVVGELGGPKSQRFQKTMHDVDAMQALIRGSK